jgi:hypothetical protein
LFLVGGGWKEESSNAPRERPGNILAVSKYESGFWQMAAQDAFTGADS